MKERLQGWVETVFCSKPLNRMAVIIDVAMMGLSGAGPYIGMAASSALLGILLSSILVFFHAGIAMEKDKGARQHKESTIPPDLVSVNPYKVPERSAYKYEVDYWCDYVDWLLTRESRYRRPFHAMQEIR